MSFGRQHLVRGALVAGLSSLAAPAAAAASPLGSLPTPTALFGLDVGSLVQGIIEKLVSLILPGDLAGRWAVGLIRWLVVVPDVADPQRFPHLNAFRSGLVGIGFALLLVSVTVCGLQVALGAPILAPAAKRTVVAAAVLVGYPKLISTAVLGGNILTAQLVTSRLVADGTDKMLGAALIVGVATGGFGWSLVLGAAVICLYFIAALMVMKIGLTALLAVLLLAGTLAWGLYPNPGTSWIARAWTSALVTVALIPIGWALVFSAGALLSSDSLVWAGSDGTLGDQLEKVTKPFAALACLWVAYKTPSFLLAAARTVGITPGSVLGNRGESRGASSGPVASAVQTNRDRFRAIGHRLGAKAGPVASNIKSRAAALRTTAQQTSFANVATAASVGAGATTTTTGRVFDRVAVPAVKPVAAAAGAAAGAGASVGRLGARVAGRTKAIASLPVKANRGWRELAAQGADLRRAGERAARSTTTPSAHDTAGRRPHELAAEPARRERITAAPSPETTSATTGSANSTTPSQPVPLAPRPAAPRTLPVASLPGRAVTLSGDYRVGASRPQTASSPPAATVADDNATAKSGSGRRHISSLGASVRAPAAPTVRSAPSSYTDARGRRSGGRPNGDEPTPPLRAPAPEARPAAPPRRRPS